jgi:hypothetical protein
VRSAVFGRTSPIRAGAFCAPEAHHKLNQGVEPHE